MASLPSTLAVNQTVKLGEEFDCGGWFVFAKQ